MLLGALVLCVAASPTFSAYALLRVVDHSPSSSGFGGRPSSAGIAWIGTSIPNLGDAYNGLELARVKWSCSLGASNSDDTSAEEHQVDRTSSEEVTERRNKKLKYVIVNSLILNKSSRSTTNLFGMWVRFSLDLHNGMNMFNEILIFCNFVQQILCGN